MIYTLMNKNNAVLHASYNEELGVFNAITRLGKIEYAPLSLINNEGVSLKALNEWFRGRAIPYERDGIRQLLEYLNLTSSEELLMKNHCLSLSDQYWIYSENENLTWDKINYFHNKYNPLEFISGTFGETTSSRYNHLFNNRNGLDTPNNTAGGMLRKVWIQDEKMISSLFKSASSVFNLEPIVEHMASKIGEVLDVPVVPYDLQIMKDKRRESLVSVCPCMINDSQEIVPAYDILVNHKLKGLNFELYSNYVKWAESQEIPRAAEYIQKMVMIDYLIVNEDRHFNNFGVIRNVETLKWESICPIYDSGRSMNTTVSKSYWAFDDESIELKFFDKGFINGNKISEIFTLPVTSSQINQLHDLKKVLENDLLTYQSNLNLDIEAINELLNGYDLRVKSFQKTLEKKGLILNTDINENKIDYEALEK